MNDFGIARQRIDEVIADPNAQKFVNANANKAMTANDFLQ